MARLSLTPLLPPLLVTRTCLCQSHPVFTRVLPRGPTCNLVRCVKESLHEFGAWSSSPGSDVPAPAVSGASCIVQMRVLWSLQLNQVNRWSVGPGVLKLLTTRPPGASVPPGATNLHQPTLVPKHSEDRSRKGDLLSVHAHCFKRAVDRKDTCLHLVLAQKARRLYLAQHT